MTKSETAAVRYTGPGAQLPEQGIEAVTGRVYDLPPKVAAQLVKSDEWELLDEVELPDPDEPGGVRVTSFVTHVPVTVSVAKASAGSAYFEDGTEIPWTSDGESLELSPEQADQLRGYTGEFGFDGDPAPEKPEPTEMPAAEPEVTEPVVETAAQRRRREAAEAEAAAQAAADADAAAAQG